MQGPTDPTSEHVSCKAASSAFGSKIEGKSNSAKLYYESTQVNQIKTCDDKKQDQRLYSENIEQKKTTAADHNNSHGGLTGCSSILIYQQPTIVSTVYNNSQS